MLPQTSIAYKHQGDRQAQLDTEPTQGGLMRHALHQMAPELQRYQRVHFSRHLTEANTKSMLVVKMVSSCKVNVLCQFLSVLDAAWLVF